MCNERGAYIRYNYLLKYDNLVITIFISNSSRC